MSVPLAPALLAPLLASSIPHRLKDRDTQVSMRMHQTAVREECSSKVIAWRCPDSVGSEHKPLLADASVRRSGLVGRLLP